MIEFILDYRSYLAYIMMFLDIIKPLLMAAFKVNIKFL